MLDLGIRKYTGNIASTGFASHQQVRRTVFALRRNLCLQNTEAYGGVCYAGADVGFGVDIYMLCRSGGN